MDIGTCEFSLKRIYALSTIGPELETGSLEISMIDTFIIDTVQGDTYIIYNDNKLEFYILGQLKLYLPCTAVGNDVYVTDDGDLSIYDSSGKIFIWPGGKKIIFSGKELQILDDADEILFYI